MAEEVKLYGTWASPYSRRIELALKLKGVTYEYFEEDLSNKSPDLLKYNPVHEKIPVLVHNGKPVAESLVILEYIDETWKNNPLLPLDPHKRATARFWARFIDEKLFPTARTVYFGEENEQEQAIEEYSQQLKLLENELDGKDFFGGDTIGYLDIVASVLAVWFVAVTQKVVGVEVCNQEDFPVLFKWISKLQDVDVIDECRPPTEKLFAYNRALYDASKPASK